jgi:hypothetical protein
MLAGINQSLFLHEWGFPEVEIGLDRIQGFFKQSTTFMEARPSEENDYSMWIYKSRNKVLFFMRGTMVSHLTCTDFKERWRTRSKQPEFRAPGKHSVPSASVLSLVA